MKIGAQMYTVRGLCQTKEGLAESLKRVADIGYTTVQISGSCPVDAQWLRGQLDANGLSCVITHTPLERLIHETEQVAHEHEILGCRCVGLGMFTYDKPEEGRTYDAFVPLARAIAQGLKAQGRYFMYHNHAHEFAREGGRVILERLAEDIPADEMGFTLDTFWIQAGGADPAQWIERLSGRVPCIHLKDYAYCGERRMAPIGEGNINFDRVFAAAESAGTEYMLVEQDDCYGEDPFDCLARSYAYLKACGFR